MVCTRHADQSTCSKRRANDLVEEFGIEATRKAAAKFQILSNFRYFPHRGCSPPPILGECSARLVDRSGRHLRPKLCTSFTSLAATNAVVSIFPSVYLYSKPCESATAVERLREAILVARLARWRRGDLSQSYVAIANHRTKRPTMSPSLRPSSRAHLTYTFTAPFLSVCPSFWHKAMLDSPSLSTESPLNFLANPADSSLLTPFDPESIQSELALWESLNFSFTDMDTSKDGNVNNSSNNSSNNNNNLNSRSDTTGMSRSAINASQSSNSGSVRARDTRINILNIREFRIHLKLF